MTLIAFLACAGLAAGGAARAATVLQFDDFNDWQEGGSLSTGANEAASGWKNVTGLTDLTGVVASGGGNWWDRSGDGEGANTATRIRYTSGQITTDAPMALASLGATSATIAWDFAPDSADYNVGLYYSADADASSMVLLDVNNGSRAVAYQWESDSVTISDGVDGITFTDTAYFVFKYHSGSNVGNPDDQYFDNIEISYVPEPGPALLVGLGGLGFVLRRRRS